ncbi:MAG: hypothetical protein U0Y68_03625 [Blastocatellia bacterium]
MFFEVLLEGDADAPVVKEIFQRKFQLQEHTNFRLHPHRGKGKLPGNPLSRPDPKHQALLDQLPAKLRGYAQVPSHLCIIVLVDVEYDHCVTLKTSLLTLQPRPRCTLFRIAIEETESWFIADPDAIKKAFPKAKTKTLVNIPPDSICGAWEKLAEALGRKPKDCSGEDKHEWATKIAPHLDLDFPKSPSLRHFIEGVDKIITSQVE